MPLEFKYKYQRKEIPDKFILKLYGVRYKNNVYF